MLSIIEATEAETLLQNLEDQQNKEDEAAQTENPATPAVSQPPPTIVGEDAKTQAPTNASNLGDNPKPASPILAPAIAPIR